MARKEIQAVLVVNRLVATWVVTPDSRGAIISSQYKTACIGRHGGVTKRIIKAAEDKINFVMMSKLAWAPGMISYGQGEEYTKIEWDKKQITILMVDGDSLVHLLGCKKELKQEVRNIAGRYLDLVPPLAAGASTQRKREMKDLLKDNTKLHIKL